MDLQRIKQLYLIDFTMQMTDISYSNFHLTLYTDVEIQE